MIRYRTASVLLLLPIAFIFGNLLKGIAFAATLSTTKPNLEFSSDSFKVALTSIEAQQIRSFLASGVPVGNNNYVKYGYYGAARTDLRNYFEIPLALPIQRGTTSSGSYESVRFSDGSTATARSYSNTGFPTLQITLRTGATY